MNAFTDYLTDERCAVMRKTLEHVIAHPDEWNQGDWGVVIRSRSAETACQTAYCFAGHVAVTVLGMRPLWSNDDGCTARLMSVTNDHRRDAPASEAARDALGLTNAQSLNLFRGNNSLRRVAELCYLYSGGRVDLLHALPTASHRDQLNEASTRQQDEYTAHDDHAAWCDARIRS